MLIFIRKFIIININNIIMNNLWNQLKFVKLVKYRIELLVFFIPEFNVNLSNFGY